MSAYVLTFRMRANPAIASDHGTARTAATAARRALRLAARTRSDGEVVVSRDGRELATISGAGAMAPARVYDADVERLADQLSK